MESPAALMKRNAFRPWNVLLSNPEENGWPLMTFSASHGFGMACEKRLHFGRIGLARFGVGLRREQLLVKGLGGADRKYRQVDHRGSPQFAVGQGKLQPQAAHRVRLVGRIGLSAPQGEAADHGHAPRSKDGRFRETDAVPIALEEPGNAHPLGMVATEAGVDSIDLLETVGEPRGRQLIRSEPPAEIGERRRDRRKGDADQCESCQCAGLAEARRRRPSRVHGNRSPFSPPIGSTDRAACHTTDRTTPPSPAAAGVHGLCGRPKDRGATAGLISPARPCP